MVKRGASSLGTSIKITHPIFNATKTIGVQYGVAQYTKLTIKIGIVIVF
jgi:hypothetical protein